jgi:flagellar biosynthesis protein FlhB
MSYFPYIAVWRIGEATLIIQAPTHHAMAVGYKCIQGLASGLIKNKSDNK